MTQMIGMILINQLQKRLLRMKRFVTVLHHILVLEFQESRDLRHLVKSKMMMTQMIYFLKWQQRKGQKKSKRNQKRMIRRNMELWHSVKNFNLLIMIHGIETTLMNQRIKMTTSLREVLVRILQTNNLYQTKRSNFNILKN